MSSIQDKIVIFADLSSIQDKNTYIWTVGQLRAGEVDFVCCNPKGEQLYIQASYIIADDKTRKREFGNLHAIKDNYPKYVISMTPFVSRSDDGGVVHLHLRNFLMNGLR